MRGVKKENLPSKVCLICNRPFTWRKKWERCWDEVTTCSKSCNARRKAMKKDSLDVVKDHHVSADSDEIFGSNIDDVREKGRVLLRAASFSDDDIKADTIKGDEQIFGINDHVLEDLFPNVDSLDIDNSDDEPFSSNKNAYDSGRPIESFDKNLVLDCRAKRKAEKKRVKAERRAQREGRGDPSAGQKPCDICQKSVNLLVRCTYDSSETWRMVCGSCWRDVSGGVVDGDDAHPFYRYGGLWKNRRKQKS
ncbi:hypothetical protein HJC23_007203 [Cyclotella cryptica]|uniref:DUF2256 domain-containing protein n=1 Tax=Cyclotella cryptica TaxID=29204 RepID=A0ABD3QQG0_9STRA|eukprot:CCRYP_003492-RA/>CCRYP_003492-RA protein AED:0.00 eAED:-0.00 QI:0/-1/0/1/-1/1/1/0/249